MHTLWNLLTGPFRILLDSPRWVLRLSLPARIALMVAVFLIVFTIFGVAIRLLDAGGVSWKDSLADLVPYIVLLVLLLAVTPPVVYMAARVWLERDVGRWPDILTAWQAALVELGREGLRLDEIPLFLVVGATGDDEEMRLLDQSPKEFAVRAAPSWTPALGPPPLHVYGGPEAVFLCIATASHASDTARRRPHGGGGPRSLLATSPPAAADISKTQDISQLLGEAEAGRPGFAASSAPAPAATATGNDVFGTLLQPNPVSPAAGTASSPQATPVSGIDRERLGDRLNYLCQLIRRERRGIAPINGVLALVPWSHLTRSPDAATAFGRALGDDLAGMMTGLGLRAPVTVLVSGMQEDPGFLEMLRRMPDGGLDARVGQRYPIGARMSHEKLGLVASRACGMVEDQVEGRILRVPKTISAPSNADLVSLVCRLRSEVAPRLSAILRRAFAPRAASDDTAPLLTGCYFAADGASKGQVGFVKGVFEKVLDAQGHLEWTRAAEEENAKAELLARILWAASGLALAAVAAGLGFRFLGGRGGAAGEGTR